MTELPVLPSHPPSPPTPASFSARQPPTARPPHAWLPYQISAAPKRIPSKLSPLLSRSHGEGVALLPDSQCHSVLGPSSYHEANMVAGLLAGRAALTPHCPELGIPVPTLQMSTLRPGGQTCPELPCLQGPHHPTTCFELLPAFAAFPFLLVLSLV